MELENTKDNPQSRVIYLDLLRITAAFGVILLHIAASRWLALPVTSPGWKITNMYNGLVRWTVPMFVMLSGVFHLEPNTENIPFKQEMKIIGKKINKLLIALVFWGVVYYYLGTFVSRRGMFHAYDIMQIPLGILLGPPWVHLWFLYMLIGLYLLTPLLRRLIAQCEQVHVEYLLALFFIVGYGVPFLNILLDYLPYSIIKGRDLYLPISELTGFAGYYIAGYYVTHFKIGKRLKTILYSAAIVSMLLTILGNYWDSAYKGKAMETFFGNLLPNTMFVTYGIFLLFQDLFCERNFARKTKAIIVHLSNHSFGIYLVHILVIWIFEILNINIFTIDLPLIICIPVFSVVVMILSYMAAVFLSKIPVRKKYITLGVFLVCAFGIGISHSVSERAQQVPVSTFTETLSPIEAMHVSSANHGMEIERLIKSGVSYESETIQRLVREQQRLKNQIDSANEVIKTQEEL